MDNENEHDGGTMDIQVLFRGSAGPCGCPECGQPVVVPVVVGCMPALVVTMSEDGFGSLSRVAIDVTGPETVEDLVDFLDSLAGALRDGVTVPGHGD